MDEDVEDIVGDVKCTDSQKSVTISAGYSQDFTDSSSDKNTSSGKDTYVIACDSDDSDKIFHLHKSQSTINLMDTTKTLDEQDFILDKNQQVTLGQSTCLQNCIFTQTSKTIMELAQNELHINKRTDTLETQTSFVSITENKTVQYTIQILDAKNTCDKKEIILSGNDFRKIIQHTVLGNDPVLTNDIANGSYDVRGSKHKCNENISCENVDDNESERFLKDKSEEKTLSQQKHIQSDSTEFDSDIECDSLEDISEEKNIDKENKSDTSEVPTSIDCDIEELYNKLSGSPFLLSPLVSSDPVEPNIGILTPLTEETAQKRDIDISPSAQTLTQNTDDETLFINNGIKVKMLSQNNLENDELKLPPIINHRFSKTPNLNSLFSLENHTDNRNVNKCFDRWEVGAKELASGESPLITGRNDSTDPKDHVRLPPIHLEGLFCTTVARNKVNWTSVTPKGKTSFTESPFDVISINGKIKELKMNTKKSGFKYESRSGSPTSVYSPEERKLNETAEKGCEALCSELLRKLRSSSWLEVTETLDELPKSLEKFWLVISENRIVDLLRKEYIEKSMSSRLYRSRIQVAGHIESPRTQVARSACNTLAEIIKNTNYTKKPDFYEGISILLTKSGSFNRAVRRAANVALDDIVCKVDITHSITAICIYGVGHKNALVRSASARLLVVCCALAEGGRQMLRSRPTTAVTARKHALRALAELLQDKNTDTRKYAERLYAMLRPLQNFEAYFLTDVNTELATRHMKKYDQLLLQNKQSR